MSKRLCKKCGETPLHHDNKSGICRECKKQDAPAPAKPTAKPAKVNKEKASRQTGVLELTAKESDKPHKGLNLMVLDAVKHLGAEATVANIATHMQKQAAFKDHEQDPARAARWHSWHLVKTGFLKKRKHA